MSEPQWGPARTFRAGRVPTAHTTSSAARFPADGAADEPPPARPAAAADRFPWQADEEPAAQYGPPHTHRAGRAAAGRDLRKPAYRNDTGNDFPSQLRPAGGPHRGRGRRRRRPLRRGLLVLLLLLLLVAYPTLLATTVMKSVTKTDALAEAGQTGHSRGRVYLVVGSDSRAGANLNDDTPGQRADTIMLLNVPWTGPSTLVSIPRDSYVEIPGHGMRKINAAYALGGPSLLASTVERATGVQVDDYVETGLGGFAGMVDAVGGVELCPDRDMDDKDAGLHVGAGCQQMNGATALAYARARHSDPRGDLGRVERQREVLAAIVHKSATPGTVLNPFSAFPLARSGGEALTVDESTGPVDLARFVLGMRSVTGEDALSMTVPVSNPALSTPHGVAVEWADSADELFAALADSDTDRIRQVAESAN
ncbi:MAG: transcriptional regulator [Micrococcales bacterium]|nr:MAG: transcriptional regulator [Micrococcales bacterium]